MSGPEALKAIKRLGLSKARFARLAYLHPNALTKWAKGAQPHGPAVALIELLTARPEMIHVLEAKGDADK